MTFDEAFEKTIEIANEFEGVVPNEDIYVIIEQLREEYAPTIEMTNIQAMFISEQYSVVNLLADVESIDIVDNDIVNYFDEEFWKPLSQREVISAWLNPETIKVVDE